MSRHTPGPWIAHQLNHAADETWLQVSRLLPDGKLRGPVCRPASQAEPLKNGAVAEIRHMATSNEEQWANAYMLAASTRLYEACIEAMSLLKGNNDLHAQLVYRELGIAVRAAQGDFK